MSSTNNKIESDFLVSVIIPFYNAELYIAETIASVLKQSYHPIEIICIDNQSTDASVKIVKKIALENDSIILTQESKKGASQARTKGLNSAKGAFIQFLDADDIILPNKIELQLKQLLAGNFDMVVSDRSIYDMTLNKQINHLKFSKIIDAPLVTAISTVISSGNPLYTKSIVEKVGGYSPNLNICQDWDFHLKLIKADAKICYLPGDFFHSRQVTNSLSSDWLKVSLTMGELIKNYKSYFIKNNVHADKLVYHKIIQTYLQNAIHTNNKTQIESNILELKFWSQGNYKINLVLNKTNSHILKILGLKNYIHLKRITTKVKL